MSSAASSFLQQNLVSSRSEDDATLLDPNFINAWGVALRPAGFGGHWWVANTDTSRVTLYVGDSDTVSFGQDGLSVVGVPGASAGDPVEINIDPPTQNGVPLPPPNPTPATVMPPSNPTGQVYSGSTTGFLVSGTSLTGATLTDAPARFITVSEDGTIAAWGETGASPAQRMNAFAVVVDNSATGAIYKGVTVSGETGSGNQLLAANFSQGRIDVFDAQWNPVATSGFVVEDAPGGRDAADYAPFNIERVFDSSRGEDVLIVAYAKVANATEGEEESTDGFIVKYDLDGNFILASDAGGLFNAPWGVALAPDDFSAFSGSLLIGNFGDGKIIGLDIETLEPDGLLLDGNGDPVVIDGLWDLAFGNGASLGRSNYLYFSAGPEEETQGLFGSLSASDAGDEPIRFRGTDGDDVKSGGADNDVLNGKGGDDTLLGNRGADVLRGGEGDDKLFGGADDDRLFGDAGKDSLFGGRGDDVLRGGSGKDALFGGIGDDRLHGEDGDDSLDGGIGDDVLRGGSGRDTLNGGDGDDRLFSENGDDKLVGGNGDDVLRGGSGRDALLGYDGDDRLFGEDGNDTLEGGAGDDRLDGGAGRDVLTGGLGEDLFVFRDGGKDEITDFVVGQDEIAIRDFDVNEFADLSIRSGANGDAVVRWDGGQVTLTGVAAASLSNDDFILI
jgi:uncharacterized protein (TIGR03118 family)